MPSRRRDAPSPTPRAWLRQDPGAPVRYSLRFEVDGGVGRLIPLPAHASARLQRGTAGATVDQVDVHELFVIQLLASTDGGRTWSGGPVLPQGGALLHDLPVGEWVSLTDARDARDAPDMRAESPRALPRTAPGHPDLPDDLPTEVGLMGLPPLDDGLPPLHDDAPTDLNLLPPPMARLQALRRHRELVDG